MKLVHIESGLGNQMLSYCEFLVLRKLHPDDDIFIETIIYDIPETNEVIKQWNGYELKRIFGINAPNVRSLFTNKQWKDVMENIRSTHFWLKNWNYPVYITQALNHEGLNLKNIRGDFESKAAIKNTNMLDRSKPSLKQQFIDTRLGANLRRFYRMISAKKLIHDFNHYNQIFYKGKEDIFTGQWLGLKMRESGIDFINKELHEAFTFPEWRDSRNKDLAELLYNSNSVAIHARRGDMLGCNGYCYKYGYFRRAVKHIKRNVRSPLFVFFCDPGSIKWCRGNEHIFNLDFRKDKVIFVDWNKGNESFRDMQLMSYCKHAIITNSSFGWWGSYFIENPNKITISPIEEIATNTTFHC